ncbi:S-layer homology domain-containing protein [Candidatus Peregrinibacteria bacterium]|nr:S-layer homology domain-containing protein [Candidatus Peregrinibacteria bacterium]
MKKPSASSLILFGFSLGILTTSAGAAMNGSSVFPDIPAGAYYDAAVGEMYGLGIIKGYSTGKFGANDYVTRGQVAVMMQRLRNDILGITPSTDTGDTSSRSSRSRSTSSSSSSSSSSEEQLPSAVKAEAGLVHFTTGSYKVEEAKKTVTIDVERYSGTKGKVTVDYSLAAGTATEGTDYTAATGTLTFNDGESKKTFTVTIVDDTEKEENQTIVLELKNARGGAALGTPAKSTLSIIDDDLSGTPVSTTTSKNGVLVFSATEYQIAENGGTITITVERNTGSEGAVAVNYATSNGSATADNYTTVNGTLNFGAGETSKTFTVTVKDNGDISGNKTIKLTLSNPTGGAVFSGSPTSLITVIDNEVTTNFGSGSIKLGDDNYTVLESDGAIAIVVKRAGGTKGQVTVQYATTSGTAKSAEDFTDTTGTLTFRPGESSKVVVIPIKSDVEADNGETFSFKLSNVVGATLDSPATTSIEIQ